MEKEKVDNENQTKKQRNNSIDSKRKKQIEIKSKI
jgi:hypothetical protein